MTAVHQLLPAAAPHDAITGQAFGWRDLLRSWGYESEIVAEHVHPDMMGAVQRLDRAGRRMVNAGGLLLRYALWSATAEAALRAGGPVALGYHNITPGELLRDFNPGLADLCDRGRAALPRFAGKIDTLVADSSFNAAELRDAGLGEATVVPLLLELPPEVLRRSPNREPVVVTVGRIVPNKRLEDIVKAFALYQRRHAPEASLVIVGSDVGFENYRHALEVLIARIGVHERVLHRRDLLGGARRVVPAGRRLPVDVGARGFLRPVDRGPCARRAGRGTRPPGQCPKRSAARGSCSMRPTIRSSRKRFTSLRRRRRPETRSTTPPTVASRSCGRTCSPRAYGRPSAPC